MKTQKNTLAGIRVNSILDFLIFFSGCFNTPESVRFLRFVKNTPESEH
jgi:hypothetical protein